VLTIFYLVYSLWASRAQGAPPPASQPQPQPHWQAQAEPEPEPAAPPVRRARITVMSHGEEAAAGALAAPASPGAGTAVPPERES
jgi:hypothetical protein